MSSVYNLLLGSTQTWSSLESTEGSWMVMSGRESREMGRDFFFVDRTPLRDWVRCPLSVSTKEGQNLAALARVRPDHEAKLP